MARLLALLLIVTVPLTAQSILQIRVIEGEGAVYPIGSRATRGITVQVTDETGKPVEAAAVTFRLPEDGPTGTFSAGGRTEVATTGPDGRALVWGMQWNREPGPFEIRITAVKGQASAGAVSPQYLTDALLPAPGAEPPPPPRSRRKLWIALAAVGAVAAAVAVSSSSSAATPAGLASPISNPRIGAPSITLGKP